MQIIVAMQNYCRNLNNLMDDLKDRLSILQPRTFYNEGLIDIPDSNVVIQFKPAHQNFIRGTRPDYYWTDSYDVDKYYRYCGGVKCLQNFTELTDVVLKECIARMEEDKKENLKQLALGLKIEDKPGYPTVIRCNCE